MFARDMFISLANKLPENLQLDAVNEHGLFCAAFLLRLTEEQLCDLRKEARKHDKENIFLLFYCVSEENASSQVPYELKDLNNFDFSKVVSCKFNGNTSPFLQYRNWEPYHYVTVTFVIKKS